MTGTRRGQVLQLMIGAVLIGLFAYYTLGDIFGWWIFGLYLASIPVGLALRRILKKRYPETF